jgi:cell division septum initiation protein DivIVA
MEVKMFNKFFKKKELEINKTQLDVITSCFLEQFDVYRKGQLKEFLDDIIKLRYDLHILSKRVDVLEKQVNKD